MCVNRRHRETNECDRIGDKVAVMELRGVVHCNWARWDGLGYACEKTVYVTELGNESKSLMLRAFKIKKH